MTEIMEETPPQEEQELREIQQRAQELLMDPGSLIAVAALSRFVVNGFAKAELKQSDNVCYLVAPIEENIPPELRTAVMSLIRHSLRNHIGHHIDGELNFYDEEEGAPAYGFILNTEGEQARERLETLQAALPKVHADIKAVLNDAIDEQTKRMTADITILPSWLHSTFVNQLANAFPRSKRYEGTEGRSVLHLSFNLGGRLTEADIEAISRLFNDALKAAELPFSSSFEPTISDTGHVSCDLVFGPAPLDSDLSSDAMHEQLLKVLPGIGAHAKESVTRVTTQMRERANALIDHIAGITADDLDDFPDAVKAITIPIDDSALSSELVSINAVTQAIKQACPEALLGYCIDDNKKTAFMSPTGEEDFEPILVSKMIIDGTHDRTPHLVIMLQPDATHSLALLQGSMAQLRAEIPHALSETLPSHFPPEAATEGASKDKTATQAGVEVLRDDTTPLAQASKKTEINIATVERLIHQLCGRLERDECSYLIEPFRTSDDYCTKIRIGVPKQAANGSAVSLHHATEACKKLIDGIGAHMIKSGHESIANVGLMLEQTSVDNPNSKDFSFKLIFPEQVDKHELKHLLQSSAREISAEAVKELKQALRPDISATVH